VWGDPIYHLPKDSQSFLTYEGDPLRAYKQAAAVLTIYPLQYPPAEAQARVMMDRFADKVTKNGPAMSDAIHALIWARLGESEKAYTTWRDGWQPFTTSPLMLFSEKRSRARTYFTTGAGGCLQTVLYGFLGVRIDTKVLPGTQWSIPLENGRILSIKPNLPKAWNRITVRGLSILGQRYDVVADRSSVRVTRQTSGVRE
jgi:trehalose/maltose hydrolase-like predicted phosphorylase